MPYQELYLVFPDKKTATAALYSAPDDDGTRLPLLDFMDEVGLVSGKWHVIARHSDDIPAGLSGYVSEPPENPGRVVFTIDAEG